ncbi:MAG: UDP-N-acetylglucosamine 2-epimerase [Gallionella sp.]|nr:UDP-N-acetylglucosamine 2-epimerase [Gallionella sp.]
MKKILAITTIRSDYDLMSGLYRLLDSDAEIELKLLVAGAHLSFTYGNTVDLIKKDGFGILAEIESLIDSDSQKARLKTASIMLQNAVDVVASWMPDLILYAGDREDVLVGGMLGTFLNIPTIHFFGGDHEKDGHADTVVRHATSKLSTFHVVSIDQHKQRLLKMGESANRIFVAGSIALDKFVSHRSGTLEEARRLLPEGKKLDGYAMVIYHPVDQERADAGVCFENILLALKKSGIPAIVSYPNSDPGNHLIIEKIAQYENDPAFWFYKNLNRETFLSLYKQARFLIGNSSSGILEAASIPLGAINVGLRQKGRYCGDNVLFCDNSKDDIEKSVSKLLSDVFQRNLAEIKNPYGDGNSCKKVYELIRTTDFSQLLKKTEDPLEMN